MPTLHVKSAHTSLASYSGVAVVQDNLLSSQLQDRRRSQAQPGRTAKPPCSRTSRAWQHC